MDGINNSAFGISVIVSPAATVIVGYCAMIVCSVSVIAAVRESANTLVTINGGADRERVTV